MLLLSGNKTNKQEVNDINDFFKKNSIFNKRHKEQEISLQY